MEEAVEGRLLSRYSPVCLLAEELEFKWLVLCEDDSFFGPPVGMAELVDALTLEFSVERLLDLCCGTGAITKIALRNGVREATCVDMFIRPAKCNLAESEENVTLVEEDVLHYRVEKFHDVTVLDQPEELTPLFLERVVPELRGHTHLLVMWAGELKCREKVGCMIRKAGTLFPGTQAFELWGNVVVCCPLTDMGRTYLEWLKDIFAIRKVEA